MEAFDESARQILVAIRRIIRAVELHSQRLFADYGLTAPQLAALHEIHSGGAPTPGELAKRLHLSQATVTGILERLERRSFVQRTRSRSDRRSVDLLVTEAGQVVLANTPPLLQRLLAQELGRAAEWERTLLLASLQRLASMLDADRLDASPHLAPGVELE